MKGCVNKNEIFPLSKILKNYFSRRENFGQDLLAINIQRGRDHGIPGYNAYRKACGLRRLTSWSTRPTEVEEEYWEKLKEVYETVDDIDLYVGGVGETSVRGGVVGPTFACLIADQVQQKFILIFWRQNSNLFFTVPTTKIR